MSADRAADDRAWCIAGHAADLIVGPARALDTRSDVRASVILRDPLPAEELGPPTRTISVEESGVRSFTVTWHVSGGGSMVAANPSGGNQVGWSPAEPLTWWFSPGTDRLRTSVHQRFLLRHLTTGLLERDLGGRSIHAVTARVDGGVLAVAGATRSGKTRLVNHLAAAGLVGPVVDDDCPVITASGQTATLVPRRYEVERASVQALAGLILLTEGAQRCDRVSGDRAHSLLDAIAVPWPATWLPASDRPPLPPIPSGIPALEVPAQHEEAFDDVATWAASAFRP